MDSLIFLFVTTVKSYLRQLLKKPGLLVLYSFLLLAMGGGIIASMNADMSDMRFGNATELLLTGSFVVLVFFMLSSVSKGLDTGGSFFSMSDVNFLFVSPIDPSHILTYGMLKQAGTALFGGVVIIAQAANFRNFFGINPGGTFIIFAGYVLSLAAYEALSMTIYSLTNSRRSLKRIVSGAVVALLLPLTALAAFAVAREGLWPGIIRAATGTYARLIPIAGWTSAGIAAFLSGNVIFGIICYSGNILIFLGAIAFMRRHGHDYYEDVLAATEMSATLRAARRAGDSAEVNTMRRKIRVRGTGLFGRGGSAIMGRQLRESFRLNRLGILDTYSFAVVGVAGMMAYTNRNTPGISALIITFIFAAYMQMTFMTITGPLKELTGHYIFLIPERPIAKLLWNNGVPAAKALVESILSYLLVGYILALPPKTIPAAIIANFCLCLMLLALGVWGLRFFRAAINRGILLIVYLLIAVLALLPGIIGVVFLTISNPHWTSNMVIPALLFSCWELFMAFMFTYWSRNVLHNIDMVKIEIKK